MPVPIPASTSDNVDRDKQDAVTVDSQIDGVAEQWRRVVEQPPTKLQAEQQQVKSMSKHWDRVSLNDKVNQCHGYFSWYFDQF